MLLNSSDINMIINIEEQQYRDFEAEIELAMPLQDLHRKMNLLLIAILNSLSAEEMNKFVQQLPAFLSLENCRFEAVSNPKQIQSLEDLSIRIYRLDQLFEDNVFHHQQDALICSIVLLNILSYHCENDVICKLLEMDINS